MSGLGVNVARRGAFPNDALAVGAGWARLVLDPDTDPAIPRAYREAHLAVLAVLARESFPDAGFAEWTATYARRHGAAVDAWQIGNEPDHRSPSSWDMPPAAYAALVGACAPVLRWLDPRAVVVGAGGASGDPAYFDRADILAHLDAVAVHPYGQDGDVVPAPSGNFGKASDLVGRYAALGLPVWVTEYGSDSSDEHRSALYIGDLTRQFGADPRVRVALHFCLYDWMVRGFGLYDELGRLKPQGRAFLAAATSAGGGPVATVEERLAQLERQQSLQSEAISKILADHYQDGPQSAKGLLVQLDPNKFGSLAVVEKVSKP